MLTTLDNEQHLQWTVKSYSKALKKEDYNAQNIALTGYFHPHGGSSGWNNGEIGRRWGLRK